ncbi:hypothetical protein [Kocuria sp. TGY1127_2]|uniref:hypothetical protein n=1 Tax=Kocuria sp. TGY1127_2 TaxID=2711328 RepID=UPI0015B7BF5D|nr:hypothetical protein [Kocuria sp. TGY1127_2]
MNPLETLRNSLEFQTLRFSRLEATAAHALGITTPQSGPMEAAVRVNHGMRMAGQNEKTTRTVIFRMAAEVESTDIGSIRVEIDALYLSQTDLSRGSIEEAGIEFAETEMSSIAYPYLREAVENLSGRVFPEPLVLPANLLQQQPQSSSSD